jgi:hypothetical protein
MDSVALVVTGEIALFIHRMSMTGEFAYSPATNAHRLSSPIGAGGHKTRPYGR